MKRRFEKTQFIRKNPILKLNYDAYPYQKEAFEAIKDHDYAGIFHEQGLGKTKIAIDLLVYWLEKDIVDSVLIVTKKTLVGNWQKEISQHMQMKPHIFTSNKKNNYYVFNSGAYLYLAHFQALVNNESLFKNFFLSRRVGIILDESAVIKNNASKITRAYHRLAEFIKLRIIMSGTPYANKPKDIWSQIYFLDFGKSLGENYHIFEDKYSFPREEYLIKSFARNLALLNEKIAKFTVRETKKTAGLSLPNKEYITLYADFTAEQLEIYNSAKKTLSLEIFQGDKYKIEDLAWVLHRIIRLVQITSNPELFNEGYQGTSGKMNILKSKVREIIKDDPKSKIIIWTSFIKNTEWIKQTLMEYKSVIVNGQKSDKENQDAIDAFMEDPEIKLFIATPQKAGEGLTLTAANHAIFYDRSFSLQHYLQAQDRIHRISQTKNCFIYNISIRGSIDDYIEKLVQAKNIASQLAIGDIKEETFLKEGHFDLRKTLNQILD